MKAFDLSLYLVLDAPLCRHYGMVETAIAAVSGGATIVQLRLKDAQTSERIALGHALKAALAGTQALLIINDDVEAAIAVGAHGLHIGQGDIAPELARERIGPAMILGLSTNTRFEVDAVNPGIVDYIGIGPVFGTSTKPDHDAPVGLNGLARLVAASNVPTVAIGGLKLEHARAVIETGAQGIAVVSAICGMPDPKAAASEFSARIQAARHPSPDQRMKR